MKNDTKPVKTTKEIYNCPTDPLHEDENRTLFLADLWTKMPKQMQNEIRNILLYN